jgi:predicted RNase H-like HicB family nuclease
MNTQRLRRVLRRSWKKGRKWARRRVKAVEHFLVFLLASLVNRLVACLSPGTARKLGAALGKLTAPHDASGPTMRPVSLAKGLDRKAEHKLVLEVASPGTARMGGFLLNGSVADAFAGRSPPCVGVVAFGTTLQECEAELRSTLEEWILVGLKLGHTLPVIDEIDLNEEPQREPVEAM